MKIFNIMLVIVLVILFGPTILKLLGQLFTLLYKLVSLTGYKGVLGKWWTVRRCLWIR